MPEPSQKTAGPKARGLTKAAAGPFAAVLAAPRLIDGEDEGSYLEFRTACLSALKPQDAIDAVWIQDFVDYSWEALRLRRMREPLIQAARTAAVAALLRDNCGTEWGESEQLSTAWSASEPKAVAEVDALFTARGIDTETIMATAVTAKLNHLERIDKLMGHYDHRRDAAIRSLEKRRDSLARRARDFADTLIEDAAFEELAASD